MYNNQRKKQIKISLIPIIITLIREKVYILFKFYYSS